MIQWYKLLLLLVTTYHLANSLIYPASSVLQMTVSISVPILNLPPKQRINFDWGLQMNYILPYNVSEFYNVPIWPGLDQTSRTNGSRNLSRPRREQLIFRGKFSDNDLSAGKLYLGLERLLESYGFHRTCLLRSVCDLANHPFDDQEGGHLLTRILRFLLTPTMHKGFSMNEKEVRFAYESAELNGFLGKKCSEVYSNCKTDCLEFISQLKY